MPFCWDESGTHVILSGTGDAEHLEQNVGGSVRHRGHVIQSIVKTQDVLVFH